MYLFVGLNQPPVADRFRCTRPRASGAVGRRAQLLNLIFTKHAKSPNAWAHRRWCWRNNENSRTNAGAEDASAEGVRHRRQQGRAWQPLDVGEELRVSGLSSKSR